MHQSSYSTPTFAIILSITLMVFIASIVLLPQTVMAGCYFQGFSEKFKLYSTGNSGRRRFSGRIFFRFFYFWSICPFGPLPRNKIFFAPLFSIRPDFAVTYCIISRCHCQSAFSPSLLSLKFSFRIRNL